MRIGLVIASAVLVALAGCGTAETESVTTAGSGSSSSSGSGSGSSSSGSASSGVAVATSPVPGSAEEFIIIGDRIYFDLNKSELRSEAIEVLNNQAVWLAKYPAVTIVIEGHCDERGTREYNLALGERRANSVRDYLVSRGIAGSRVEVLSYGKERPEVIGSNENAWSQNRRGVTIIKGGA